MANIGDLTDVGDVIRDLMLRLGIQWIPPAAEMTSAEQRAAEEKERLEALKEWCDHLKATGLGYASLQGGKGQFLPLHAENAVRGQRARAQDQSPVDLNPGAMDAWVDMAKVLNDKEVSRGAVVHELPVLDKAVSHLADVSLFLTDKVAALERSMPRVNALSTERVPIYLSGKELRQLTDTVNGVAGLLLKRRGECIVQARSRASFATPLEKAVWSQKEKREMIVRAGERAIQDAASVEEKAAARKQMENQLAAFDRSLAKEDVTGAFSKAKK